jgi:hypothetical protein
MIAATPFPIFTTFRLEKPLTTIHVHRIGTSPGYKAWIHGQHDWCYGFGTTWKEAVGDLLHTFEATLGLGLHVAPELDPVPLDGLAACNACQDEQDTADYPVAEVAEIHQKLDAFLADNEPAAPHVPILDQGATGASVACAAAAAVAHMNATLEANKDAELAEHYTNGRARCASCWKLIQPKRVDGKLSLVCSCGCALLASMSDSEMTERGEPEPPVGWGSTRCFDQKPDAELAERAADWNQVP